MFHREGDCYRETNWCRLRIKFDKKYLADPNKREADMVDKIEILLNLF
jgi:hypothetical protein